MAFTKGTSGNRAGRAPGTPNKATTAAREVIGAALSGTDAAKLAAQLNTLTGKDFIDAYVKLVEFVTPKLQRTAMATDERPGKVTIKIGGKRPEEHRAYYANLASGNEQPRLMSNVLVSEDGSKDKINLE